MFARLGVTLSVIRQVRGKTLTETAAAAGLGKSQLSKYENGKELPQLSTLARVLEVLDVSPAELFSTMDLLDGKVSGLGQTQEPSIEFSRSLLGRSTDDVFNQVALKLFDLRRAVIAEICAQKISPPGGRES
jgi:transcriptional regulator with XRE-family HTH domain